MEMRYVVVDMPVVGFDGDVFQEVYTAPEEANAAARYAWHMKTAQERNCRHIMAGIVTREMLPDDAVDEETGDVDWTLFTEFDSFPGSFDSDSSEEV